MEREKEANEEIDGQKGICAYAIINDVNTEDQRMGVENFSI